MIITILLALCFLVAYLYINYVWMAPPLWAKNIPSPPHNPILGSWTEIITTPSTVHLILKRYCETYGSVVFLKQGLLTSPMLIVTEPDAVLKIMKFQDKGDLYSDFNLFEPDTIQTTNGAQHTKLKSIFVPPFSVNVVKQYVPTMENAVREMIVVLNENVEKHSPVDIGKLFRQVTADILGELLLSERIGALEGSINIIDDLSELCHEIQTMKYSMFKPLVKLYKKSKINKLRSIIENYILYSIRQRRELIHSEKKDILGQLLMTTDKDTGEKLSDTVLAREMFMLMVTAYETTAHSMAFVISHLISNTETYHKVRKEIDGMWGSRDKVAEEDYDKLDYLQACINESHRLSSVVFDTLRICEEDIEIGEFNIPKGTPVWIPFSEVNTNAKLWEEPQKYIPERFFSNKKNENALQYFNPFTIGPRQCIGMNFAKLEMKVILATFIRKFAFEGVVGQNYETCTNFTHFYKDPFEVVLYKRN